MKSIEEDQIEDQDQDQNKNKNKNKNKDANSKFQDTQQDQEDNDLNDLQLQSSPKSTSSSHHPTIYEDPTGSLLSGPTEEFNSTSFKQTHLDHLHSNRKSNINQKDRRSLRSNSKNKTTRKSSFGQTSSCGRPSSLRSRLNGDNKSEIGSNFESSRPHKSISAQSENPDGGFFSNLSSLLKGKARSHSRDSHQNYLDYQYSPILDKPRRTSSIKSRNSSNWISVRSSKSKSRSATRSKSGNSDEDWPDETDSLNNSSISSTASTSTSNSDPSSSDSSILQRRSQSNRINDARIQVIPLRLADLNSHHLSISNSNLDSFDKSSSNLQPLSTQSIYIIEDDLQLQFIGWRSITWKLTLWFIGSLSSIGILSLLGRWKILLKLGATGIQENFTQASHVIAYTELNQPELIPFQTLLFDTPVKLSLLFPSNWRKPPSSKDKSLRTPIREPSQVPLPQAFDTGSTDELLLSQIRYVDFRHHRFFFHPVTFDFKMIRDWQDPNWSTSRSNLTKGLDQHQIDIRSSLFNQNIIQIEGKTTFQLLVDEVLHPFYIFQIASIILWSIDYYYYYAFCIAVISVVSISTTLIEMKKNLARMRQLSRFTCGVNVLRGSTWLHIDSTELVPGDVIDVSDNALHTFPADLLLLSGDAIVNESMLTGESIPVSKLALTDSSLELVSCLTSDPPPALTKHILFCGTSIIRVRKPSQIGSSTQTPKSHEPAMAMIFRTGFNTTKGSLVRSMLFPKPIDFAFYRDSFRFIGALAIIASLGFIGSSINFLRMGIDWHTLLIRALDLITIVVPPALPATMAIGTSFSISRLRKRDIFCISPNRVNVAGKINLVCFDKTGTLTEEGLDVLGVRSVDRQVGTFSQPYDEIEDVPVIGAEDIKTPLVYALATCHGLKVVKGQVIGDPLDLRMFEFTKWSIEEAGDSIEPDGPIGSSSASPPPSRSKTSKMIERQAALVQTIVRPPGGTTFEIEDALKSTRFLELGIIRTFDFASELRRMSVLVKKLKSPTIEAYVKGAPEAMFEICLQDTLPTNYKETLNDYTRHGYRVIAIAAKSFHKLSWIKAQRLTRSEVESQLRFLGFVIFENKLKPSTAPAIHLLQSAHIGTRMCTGDNIRTAISVGRECGMVHEYARVYMPYLQADSPTSPECKIVWFDIDDESSLLDPYTLMPIAAGYDERDASTVDSRDPSLMLNEYVLAISGDVFRWLMDNGSLETIERMLFKGVIFARMSPDEKHELVERLQSLDYTVGFCGDGANDCGALKAADVGLSLSEAEASVAAPFTSRQPDITCFIELIREGRCALVTSFSCFKYMALYSLIQFTTITLLYSLPSSLGDFQFLYIDLFIIIPVAVTMGRTHPYNRIAAKRPTANLVSKRVLTSLLGQIFINSTIQFLIFCRVTSQHVHVPHHEDSTKIPTRNEENSSLFLVSIFQYILVAATFSVGPPYRKGIFSNYLLVLCLLILGSFSVFLLFDDEGVIFQKLDLVQLDYAFKLELFIWVIFNTFASITFENYATQPIALWVGAKTKLIRKNLNVVVGGILTKRERKRYKVIGESMMT